MKKNIAIMLAAAAMLFGVGRMARAGQWGPTAYVFCATDLGRGPTLVRPASFVGQSCYLLFPGYGRVYGVWLFE